MDKWNDNNFLSVDEYHRERNLYKAEQIYVPCECSQSAQCSMFCHKFKEGGCTLYANA